MALAVAVCRGFLSNIKVQAMSLEHQRHLATLLMLKAAGELDGASDAEVACGLRMGTAEFVAMKLYWISRNIIDAEYNFLTSKRKPAAPGSSTERVRRHRERQRVIRECNAGNGALQVDVSQVHVTHDETVTVTQDETLPDVSSGKGNGASIQLEPPPIPTNLDPATISPSHHQQDSGIDLECNAKDVALHSPAELGASPVVVSCCSTSLKDSNNYNNNGSDAPGPRLAVAPPATKLAEGGQPVQKSFCATGSPPQLRQVPPEDIFKEEYKELLSLIPEKERDPKKHATDLSLLARVHMEMGFDHVKWSILYVLDKPKRNDFWAYVKGAFNNPKWWKPHRARMEAISEVEQEDKEKAAVKQAAARSQVETERDRDRVEREQSEAWERAVEEYIGNLPASELQALEAEALAKVHPALRHLVTADSPSVRGNMKELVSERLARGEIARQTA